MKMHKVKMFNYLKWSRVPPGMRGLVLGTRNPPAMGVFSNNLSTFPPWKATVRASCAGPRGLPDQPRRGWFGKQEQVSRGCGSKRGEVAQAWHVCEERVATFTRSHLLEANSHPIAERRKLKPRPDGAQGKTLPPGLAERTVWSGTQL